MVRVVCRTLLKTQEMIKNTYYKGSEVKTVPYCYILTHKKSGMLYFGSRSCRGANPDLLMVDYFSSSKLVHQILKEEGTEAFSHSVVKTFRDPLTCLNWEKRFLRKVHASTNKKFLNIDELQEREKSIQTKVRCIKIVKDDLSCCIWYPRDKIIPLGWHHGTRGVSKEDAAKRKNRRWWHNPTSNKSTFSEARPAGTIPGRGGAYKSNSISLKERGNRWYTDGINSILVGALDKVPEGFHLGRKIKHYEGIGRRRNKWMWISDGTTNKQVIKNTILPGGWSPGRVV